MCWKYYNNAIIPNTPPHIVPPIDELEQKAFWDGYKDKKVYFVRYTTDFDCQEETSWWYVIKDTPFDVSALKAKRRYEINKGNKNFEVRLINPSEHKEGLLKIQKQSFLAYPEKYRPVVDEEEFLKRIDSWTDCSVYGAFFKESGELCGYSVISEQDRCIHFSVQKTIPEYEKHGINAALVFKILEDCDSKIRQGMYICDGARSVNHETHFQDYLEKYFGFRKAYCKLHLLYKGKMKILVKLLYPFRGLLKKLDSIKLVHKINAVIRMEEIVRADRRRGKNG